MMQQRTKAAWTAELVGRDRVGKSSGHRDQASLGPSPLNTQLIAQVLRS